MYVLLLCNLSASRPARHIISPLKKNSSQSIEVLIVHICHFSANFFKATTQGGNMYLSPWRIAILQISWVGIYRTNTTVLYTFFFYRPSFPVFIIASITFFLYVCARVKSQSTIRKYRSIQEYLPRPPGTMPFSTSAKRKETHKK